MTSDGKPRFSLKSLFVATAVCAIATMALRVGDWRWARVVFTLLVILNLSASVCALYRRGGERAFCVGFAAFGWVYIFFMVSSSFQMADHLLIGREIVSLVKEFKPEASSGIVIESGGSRIIVFSFNQIVDSLVAIAFGLLGGMIGWCCYRTREISAN